MCFFLWCLRLFDLDLDFKDDVGELGEMGQVGDFVLVLDLDFDFDFDFLFVVDVDICRGIDGVLIGIGCDLGCDLDGVLFGILQLDFAILCVLLLATCWLFGISNIMRLGFVAVDAILGWPSAHSLCVCLIA